MAKKHYSAEDFQRIPLQNVVIQAASAQPSNMVAGQIYYDSALSRYRFLAGATLVTMSLEGHQHSTSDLSTGVLPMVRGGVGVSLENGAQSGVVYKDGASTLAVTAAGVAGQFLQSPGGGGAPVWATPPAQAPTGTAGGGLTGSYPNPTVALNSITADMFAAGNRDGAVGTATARSLGTGSNQAAAGNDSRLSNSRPPSGAAGGVLIGSYPNPGLADAAVSLAQQIDISLRGPADTGAGNAASNAAALRAIGVGFNGWAMDSKATLNSIADANIMQGHINFAGWLPTNLGAPVNPGDATSKNYVDGQIQNAIQGLSPKNAARLRTTAGIGLSGLAAIDGVTPVAGDRVLVANQNGASQNGIWVAASGAWSRAADANVASELQGAFVFVSEGTTYANTGWYQTADNITLDTTPITWIQFSAAGSYTAGNGLGQSGSDFFVNVDGATIEIVGDTLRVKDGGITAPKMGVGSVVLSGNTVTGVLPIASGGTGWNSAAGARSNLSVPGRNANFVPALTAGTWSGNVATGVDVSAQVVPQIEVADATTGESVEIEWRYVGTTQVNFRADVAVAANALVFSSIGG